MSGSRGGNGGCTYSPLHTKTVLARFSRSASATGSATATGSGEGTAIVETTVAASATRTVENCMTE